ncbi:MAG TPA: 2-amino-4-oxopentanoate thiolase subunit OrtB [Synergistaceae bacterium]|nr:2-amino-4-oxopentanoate thiolase subunit OrtB [Synergistaceae bacterium]HPJ26572.1 2-amino-4-oxopentanoate thiolase subunit OrtB [Synergistaceae bacterium]HPQ37737.1 2-amino-4-oxopentanoate thiolase subunit OrtB [Synergistaceae bacterium]
MKDMSYAGVMARKNEIMKKALRMDYEEFEGEGLTFDYEGMMEKAGYSMEDIRNIQRSSSVGDTPLIELKNLTAAARKLAGPGKGARIFIKDEASNPSGSFKARRASVSCYYAKQKGYEGVIAATSGNYGAAVASQANMRDLKCIIVQEVYDSSRVGQPEILEKGRKCEAYGAEVLQLTVGPELFYVFLRTLEETGFFNASLYTPFGIAGVETLGYELTEQVRRCCGRDPDAVVVTNAGGGNLTGTARGLLKAGAMETRVIGASVDLQGLHMASDRDFNRKSFTTGHTGFGVPFCTWPDRADVPRNAARPLRYMDRYVTITQGEVFYMTEALAQLEGLERGPAGNTSLTAAFAIAQEMEEDQVLVVQETEYTGAGKHLTAQLTFARERGIEVRRGNPREQIPGENILLPSDPSVIGVQDLDLDHLRRSYLKNSLKRNGLQSSELLEKELDFLGLEIKKNRDYVRSALKELESR